MYMHITEECNILHLKLDFSFCVVVQTFDGVLPYPQIVKDKQGEITHSPVKGCCQWCCTKWQRHLGTSASTKSFLAVAGSSFCHPSSICASQGMSFTEPTSLVGFSLVDKAIIWPMAVITWETFWAVTWHQCPLHCKWIVSKTKVSVS